MKRGSSLSIHSQSQVSDWSATNSEYQTSRWSTHMYLQQKAGWGVNLTQIFWERTRGTLEILHLISTPRKINGWNLKINQLKRKIIFHPPPFLGSKFENFPGVSVGVGPHDLKKRLKQSTTYQSKTPTIPTIRKHPHPPSSTNPPPPIMCFLSLLATNPTPTIYPPPFFVAWLDACLPRYLLCASNGPPFKRPTQITRRTWKPSLAVISQACMKLKDSYPGGPEERYGCFQK